MPIVFVNDCIKQVEEIIGYPHKEFRLHGQVYIYLVNTSQLFGLFLSMTIPLYGAPNTKDNLLMLKMTRDELQERHMKDNICHMKKFIR